MLTDKGKPNDKTPKDWYLKYQDFSYLWSKRAKAIGTHFLRQMDRQSKSNQLRIKPKKYQKRRRKRRKKKKKEESSDSD